MSKIVINKNLAKYYYKFVDNVFKPLTANTTVTTYSGVTPTVTAISAMREVVVTKQSTLDTLDKITKYYNDSFSYNTLGWFTLNTSTNHIETNGVLTNTYDFGKKVTVLNFTSVGRASPYQSYPFRLFKSYDGVNWEEFYYYSTISTTTVLHTFNNIETRYFKMVAEGGDVAILNATGNVTIPAVNAGFFIKGYGSTPNPYSWETDLGTIINKILTESTRATTLASLVTKGVITQAESDAMLLINLTDRPTITSTLTDDVVTFNMTNPNKLVRRYVKSTDNSAETMYLLFPYYTSNSFNGVVHFNQVTPYTYNTTTSELSKQVLSYIAISLGTTGTEDIVLDYDANIDYIDDMSFKIKLPTTIIV